LPEKLAKTFKKAGSVNFASLVKDKVFHLAKDAKGTLHPFQTNFEVKATGEYCFYGQVDSENQLNGLAKVLSKDKKWVLEGQFESGKKQGWVRKVWSNGDEINSW